MSYGGVVIVGATLSARFATPQDDSPWPVEANHPSVWMGDKRTELAILAGLRTVPAIFEAEATTHAGVFIVAAQRHFLEALPWRLDIAIAVPDENDVLEFREAAVELAVW